MSRRVFVSHSKRDERSVSALRGALERAGLETTTMKERATTSVPVRQAIDEAIGASDLVIVVLPPHGEGWMRAEIEAARRQGKPVVVVQTPASRSPGPDLREYLTVRSDLREPETVVKAAQSWLRHRPSRPVSQPPPVSALSAQEVVQWVTAFRGAGELHRLERQVAMMLSSVGVELTPPTELGPDFVAWSDGVSESLGNPFAVEIKRGVEADITAAAAEWLARSGLGSLLLVVGSEDADVEVVSTASGHVIVQIPAIDLAEELGRTTFAKAIRTLVSRTGVEL